MPHLCIPSCYKPIKVVTTALYWTDKSTELVSHLVVNWICIDDVVGLFQSYCSSYHSRTINLNINKVFTCNATILLFHVLFPDHDISFLSENQGSCLDRNYTGIDTMFVPCNCGTISDWLVNMVGLDYSKMCQASLWVPRHFLPTSIFPSCMLCMTCLLSRWMYNTHVYNLAWYRDYVTAHRICFQVYKLEKSGTTNTGKYETPTTQMDWGYKKNINILYNDKLQGTSIHLPTHTVICLHLVLKISFTNPVILVKGRDSDKKCDSVQTFTRFYSCRDGYIQWCVSVW